MARGMLCCPAMNAIFFGLKRAFHGALRITRRALAALGLTSARFDLLYALNNGPSWGVLQSALRATLGVSASVVSRMLKSLEGLGLVSRERALGDARQRRVKLTAMGRSRIRLAIWRLIRSGHVQLVVDSALAGPRWFDESACFVAMNHVESALLALRREGRDTATLHYPWHPDD